MAGFSYLSERAVSAITEYVFHQRDIPVEVEKGPSPLDLKYTHDGYNRFLDPDGYPAGDIR